MKSKVTLFLIISALLCFASLKFTQSAASSPVTKPALPAGRIWERAGLFMPVTTTLDVDRTDDNAGASACTGAANDCSLRGAIINANADLSANSFVINLQPGTTYNLTLANATQENAAATGDLDITTTLHSVTIAGGGASTVVDAAGLNTGSMRDRAFQISAGVTVIFQDLTIKNGVAADDGSSGTSTNPTAQNATRAGGGILNNSGSVTLTNVTIQSCQVVGKGDTVINDHTSLDAHGGGLASVGTGTVTITGSTFSGNSAVGGNGGNFNNGQGSNALGGSIYLESGSLNIESSRIENSTATGGQGGSVSQNGMENGGFGGNAQGGGVWVGGGTTAINNTTFDNTAANAGSSGTGGNGSEPGGEADGGGLYCVGNVTVSNSTFHLASATGGNSGNTFGTSCVGGHTSGDAGAARGGAIFIDTSGSLLIDTSTFANNAATGGNAGNGGQTDGGLNCGANGAGGLAFGGAITNGGSATLNVKHSTISGNSAQAGNSGVAQSGSTKPPKPVAQGTGGGVRVGPGGATFENTIVAGNTSANGTGDNSNPPVSAPNVDGTVTSNGHNLLGVATGATGFTGTGDQTGANPMLAALADNGGPTQTMALTAGSPAIDAGVASGASFDQRGRLRTYDDPTVSNTGGSDGTDIGAFELQPDCILNCPGNLTASNDPGECGATVTYTEPSGAGCGTVTCDHPSGSFFDVGTTTVICTSTAGPTCSFTVTVNDTEGPVVTTTNATMWPPNHKYVTFRVADLVTSASDNCDSGVTVSSVRIVKVTSDEPENTVADGNTSNDIVIAGDCKSVQLRSERMGNGNGRVYTITFKVTDSSNNTTTATAKVKVPQSQNGAPAVDDGPHYTVVGGCP